MRPARLIADTADCLGEGPVWAAAEARLYWFDIKGQRLNWLQPDSASTGCLALPLRASAAAVRPGGGLLLATESGLYALDPATGACTVREAMRFEPGFRTNDGGVDPLGRFWWSTMDDAGGARPAAIYRTEISGKTEKVLDGVHIPNTLAFNRDGSRVIIADSRRQTLFEHHTDDLTQRREFAHTRGQVATPDGGATDAKGFLWNAQWGGARVVRYAPDGSIDRIVPLPVSQPTSCAFGGPDLATLYVTSAWDGLSAAERTEQPLAGGLFAFEPGVKGLPIPPFGG